MGETLTLGNRWLGVAARLMLIGVLLGASVARATPGDTFTVGPEGAQLYPAPDAGAPVVGRLTEGRRVMEFERRGDWVRIRVLGAVGEETWVRTDRLVRSLPVPQEPPVVEIPRGPGSAEPGRTPGSHEGSGASRFRVDVSGSPALAFAAQCELIDQAGRSKNYRFRGLVPAHADFSGAALLCRIRKRDAFGRLIVTLSQDGVPIVREKTTSPFNHVLVRSDGPWGAAAGIKGGIPVRMFRNSPEAQGPIAPSQTGQRPSPNATLGRSRGVPNR